MLRPKSQDLKQARDDALAALGILDTVAEGVMEQLGAWAENPQFPPIFGNFLRFSAISSDFRQFPPNIDGIPHLHSACPTSGRGCGLLAGIDFTGISTVSSDKMRLHSPRDLTGRNFKVERIHREGTGAYGRAYVLRVKVRAGV